MSCEQNQERLHDLLDRRLSDEEEADLRVHLAACSHCAGELRELEELLATTRGVAAPELPAGFADAVMASVRREGAAGGSARARGRQHRFRLVSLGALGSIAAGFLLFVFFQPKFDSLPPAQNAATEKELAKATSPADRRREALRDVGEEDHEGKARLESAAEPSLDTEQKKNLLAKDEVSPISSTEAENPQRRKGKESSTVEKSGAIHLFAYVENANAEQRLRAWAGELAKKPMASAKEKASGEKQEESNASVADSKSEPNFALGLVAPETVLRLRVPRSQLASLQKSWKQIPGLRILEKVPAKNEDKVALGRSAPATKMDAPAAPTAGAAPSDPAPEEDMVEVVITVLPEEPAAKPK